MITESNKHGVVITPDRQQPYAVWFRGEIILFTDSLSKANTMFTAEVKKKSRR